MRSKEELEEPSLPQRRRLHIGVIPMEEENIIMSLTRFPCTLDLGDNFTGSPTLGPYELRYGVFIGHEGAVCRTIFFV